MAVNGDDDDKSLLFKDADVDAFVEHDVKPVIINNNK